MSQPELAEGAAAAAGAAAVTVRAARREDMPLIHRMIHELAQHEGVPEGPQLSAADLVEDGFEQEPPWFFALVGEVGGEVAGYALCNRAYSSWVRRALYLEDLYVRPAARRAGLGRALLQHLCQIAVREGVCRIDWHVLQGNQPAETFYEALGAVNLRLSERRDALRLHRPEIERLAAAGRHH